MNVLACHSRIALAIALCGLAGAAQATLITFDERPWVYDEDLGYDFSSNPITNEYDALGVQLDGAYLQPGPPHSDYMGSQYIMGANGFSISFTDATLPTHVRFAFGTPMQGFRSTVAAYGADGSLLGMADTGGAYVGLPDDPWWVTDRPYNDQSRASFHAQAGIARLVFDAETNPRLVTKLDNLYFGNVPAVPEPATLALWAAGLGVLGVARRSKKKASQPSASAQMLRAQPSA